MPHECTTCGRTFQDGSKEMLSGCPNCGGNKFQFLPGGKEATDAPTGPDVPNGPDSSDLIEPSTPTDVAVEGTDSTFRESNATGASDDRTTSASGSKHKTADINGPSNTSSFSFGNESQSSRKTDQGGEVSGEEFSDSPATGEDDAQASARKTVVGPEELAAAESASPAEPDHVDSTESDDRQAATDEQPDLSELREKLNDQFESIKIHKPGEYELNLMELYDREEHIIALQEDGKYIIDVPGSWREKDE